jgi:hypothetical protein
MGTSLYPGGPVGLGGTLFGPERVGVGQRWKKQTNCPGPGEWQLRLVEDCGLTYLMLLRCEAVVKGAGLG